MRFLRNKKVDKVSLYCYYRKRLDQVYEGATNFWRFIGLILKGQRLINHHANSAKLITLVLTTEIKHGKGKLLVRSVTTVRLFRTTSKEKLLVLENSYRLRRPRQAHANKYEKTCISYLIKNKTQSQSIVYNLLSACTKSPKQHEHRNCYKQISNWNASHAEFYGTRNILTGLLNLQHLLKFELHLKGCEWD